MVSVFSQFLQEAQYEKAKFSSCEFTINSTLRLFIYNIYLGFFLYFIILNRELSGFFLFCFKLC